MACCGRRESREAAPHSLRRNSPAASAAATPAGYAQPAARAVQFEYEGPTAMTVTGAVTGRRYRFGATGARLEVDSRDGPSLAAVPNLRRRRAQA
jgi:hypothetical protein